MTHSQGPLDVVAHRAARRGCRCAGHRDMWRHWCHWSGGLKPGGEGADPDTVTACEMDQETDAWLRPGAVVPVYQPIVALGDRRVVAYEALARFAPWTGFTGPAGAFAAAAAAGPEATAALDHACTAAAIRGALEVGLPQDVALFVNVLPVALQRSTPAALADVAALAQEQLRVVVEVTETDVLTRPAELLALASRVRRRGFGLAVDDVGVNPESLSLLPLLRPDVIKLDRSILTAPPTAATGRVLGAVLAAAESTGAAILAEGIETDRDDHVARTLGASYGQGWLHGRPAPLPTEPRATGRLTLLESDDGRAPASPFDLVSDRLRGVDAPYEYLLAISLDLEAKAARLDAPIVLSTFQDADRFTPATARRYTALAANASLVGALAVGLASCPAPGIRGADLSAGDPVRHDWIVVVLAPHFAAALIARDQTGSGPVRHRRYDYAVTHDPERVVLAAQSLLDRLEPTN